MAVGVGNVDAITAHAGKTGKRCKGWHISMTRYRQGVMAGVRSMSIRIHARLFHQCFQTFEFWTERLLWFVSLASSPAAFLPAFFSRLLPVVPVECYARGKNSIH